MATIISLLSAPFETRLTVKWARPPQLEPGWEGHVHKAAHDNQFETVEVRERDGRPLARLKNSGPAHSVGPRVRDFALSVGDALKIPSSDRHLNELEISSPRSLAMSFIKTLLLLIPLTAAVFGLWRAGLWWSETRSVERTVVIFLPVAFVMLVILSLSISDSDGDIRRPFESAFMRRPTGVRVRPAIDDADAQSVAVDADKIRQLELAREAAQIQAIESLNYRTRSIRDNRDQLWVRAHRAFQLACFFLFTSLAGPITTVWFLHRSQDWHYLLAGVSLAAVPLAVGLALLRHDNKLRDQHRDAETELAALDRLQLAVDYASAESKETERETRIKVIGQLLLPPDPLVYGRIRRRKGDDASDENAGVGTIVEKVTEAISAVLRKEKE